MRDALLVTLAGRMRGSVGVAWRYGVANLSRRRAESLVQIVAFGTGIMVLLLLGLVRNDLANDWRISLPDNLPNYFFINIPQNERDSFMSELADAWREPVARAADDSRTSHGDQRRDTSSARRFNNQDGEEFAGTRAEPHLGRRAGTGQSRRRRQWWGAEDAGKPLVSIATEFQESMGLKLGDKLTFDIAGETFEAHDRELPQSEVGQLPAELLHRVRARRHRQHCRHVHDERAFRRWRSALARFAGAQVSRVSRFSTSMICWSACVRCSIRPCSPCRACFFFTLFAGLTVMMAAVQASRDERRYESAMLRTLGASRNTVLQGVLAEFITLGTAVGRAGCAGRIHRGIFRGHPRAGDELRV